MWRGYFCGLAACRGEGVDPTGAAPAAGMALDSAELPRPESIATVAALDHVDAHETIVGERGADP